MAVSLVLTTKASVCLTCSQQCLVQVTVEFLTAHTYTHLLPAGRAKKCKCIYKAYTIFRAGLSNKLLRNIKMANTI